jgi:hypothetical protein
VGQQAAYSNTTGSENTAVGRLSLNANTTGSSNVALGNQALALNTTASNNTAVGYQAAYSSTTAVNNVAVGYQAGYNTTVSGANANVFLGYQAAYSSTTGDANVVIGNQAGYSITSGGGNVAIGNTAMYSLTTTRDNVAVGNSAAYYNTTGSGFTATGYRAMFQNTTGTNNVAYGSQALQNNTTGGSNVALGYTALQANTTASNNTAVGYQAGYSNTTGATNSFFGYAAGYGVTTGSKNVIIGAYQGSAAPISATGSNYIVLSDGDGNVRQTINSSGNVGIGTTSPAYKLDVNGDVNVPADSSYFIGANADRYIKYRSSQNDVLYSGYSGLFYKQDVAGVYHAWFTGNNERMRIDSSGNVLIGTTSTSNPPSQGILLFGNQTNAQEAIGHASGTGGGQYYSVFGYAGTTIGGITQNGTTGVLYNLTSDYRLKNNQQPLTGAKDFIMALQPKKWQWWDGSGEGVGFVAHEFMEVAKYSGHGEKDAVDADNKPVYQSIQPSSSEVMANLIAHIQNLETRLAALEAA